MLVRFSALWRSRPAAQEPSPMPAMNIDRTVETKGVVTPNCAMARRSQISSYRMLQNPESRKNTKYQVTGTVREDHWFQLSITAVRRCCHKKRDGRCPLRYAAACLPSGRVAFNASWRWLDPE